MKAKRRRRRTENWWRLSWQVSRWLQLWYKHTEQSRLPPKYVRSLADANLPPEVVEALLDAQRLKEASKEKETTSGARKWNSDKETPTRDAARPAAEAGPADHAPVSQDRSLTTSVCGGTQLSSKS